MQTVCGASDRWLQYSAPFTRMALCAAGLLRLAREISGGTPPPAAPPPIRIWLPPSEKLSAGPPADGARACSTSCDLSPFFVTADLLIKNPACGNRLASAEPAGAREALVPGDGGFRTARADRNSAA